MSRLKLNAGQVRALKRQLAEAQDARLYRRTLAVLEIGRGTPVARVARTLGVSRQTLHHWLEKYRHEGHPSVLAEGPRSGRPSFWTAALRRHLSRLLASVPEHWGYYAVDWTVPLLQEQLQRLTSQALSEDTLRRELARRGYVWKRSRYVLAPDPEKEKKTADPSANTGFAAPQRGAGGR